MIALGFDIEIKVSINNFHPITVFVPPFSLTLLTLLSLSYFSFPSLLIMATTLGSVWFPYSLIPFPWLSMIIKEHHPFLSLFMQSSSPCNKYIPSCTPNYFKLPFIWHTRDRPLKSNHKINNRKAKKWFTLLGIIGNKRTTSN